MTPQPTPATPATPATPSGPAAPSTPVAPAAPQGAGRARRQPTGSSGRAQARAWPPGGAVAVVPVREGALPAGADEVVAEAGGCTLVIGSGAAAAAAELSSARGSVLACEAGPFAPGRWAHGLAPHLLDAGLVLLPASPDGRDLAPRLAAALDRPLHAGCIVVRSDRVVRALVGGRVGGEVRPTGPFVATLQPGVRGTDPDGPAAPPPIETLVLAEVPSGVLDAEVLGIAPPDPATVDLAEAERIVAGGGGLGGAAAFAQLAAVGRALGAALGATRVVTDAGLVAPERQIGTTGVDVRPQLYLAVGISGAVQHVSGIGRPRHVVAVNLDPSCPMMALADLALVTDAPALVGALAARLRMDGATPVVDGAARPEGAHADG